MSDKVTGISIGSDVEFFVQHKTSGEIVSAEGLIEGTKEYPFHFDPKNDYFATSLDNVLAEGNIPPATSALEFYNNVETLRKYIDSILPKELITTSIPSARLDNKYLDTDNARIYGCSPSWNCWTGEVVRPEPSSENVRAAGFHIHTGYNNPTEDVNTKIARAMDLFLGVPSVLLEPVNERKSVGYGCAGNFRHQNHGLEYRSLSSYFASTKNLIEWCYNNARAAIDFVNNNRVAILSGFGEEIQRIINNEDKKAAEVMIKRFAVNYNI